MTDGSRKAGLTFEENRKNLLNDLQATASSGVVEKKVHFHNDDVPTLLDRLKQFERKSRETVLIIK